MAQDGSRDFAEKFYSKALEWKIRGVPSTEDEKKLEPYFSKAVLELFQNVNVQRKEWAAKFPRSDEKPPWTAEGDAFSSVWEGPSEFRIGTVAGEGGGTLVMVHLEYKDASGTTKWTDRLRLERVGESWRIEDILFHVKGTLVESIKDGLHLVAKELKTQ